MRERFCSPHANARPLIEKAGNVAKVGVQEGKEVAHRSLASPGFHALAFAGSAPAAVTAAKVSWSSTTFSTSMRILTESPTLPMPDM